MKLHLSEAFYAVVVSMFSVGELVGSLSLGILSKKKSLKKEKWKVRNPYKKKRFFLTQKPKNNRGIIIVKTMI